MHRRSLLLGISLFAACATSDAAVVPDDPVACDVPGLANCRQAGDVMFGGQPSPATLRHLAGLGYTTVVSTRGPEELSWDERAAVEALGMRFVLIPMPHPVTNINDTQLAALDSVLTGNEGPVLLHCASGNRSAGLWGAWLAQRQGVDPDAALRLAAGAGMTSVRPAVEQRLAECTTC
jgi:uncharacterized protein (TIGR01244 family)